MVKVNGKSDTILSYPGYENRQNIHLKLPASWEMRTDKIYIPFHHACMPW